MSHSVLIGGSVEKIFISENETIQIASPYYPFNYPNNLNMTWIIVAPPDQKIRITFHTFESERNFDYFRAGDGDDIVANEFFLWHGSREAPELMSAENQIWLRFTSDGIATSVGFSLLASCVPWTGEITIYT